MDAFGTRAQTYDNLLKGPGKAYINADLSILLDPNATDRLNRALANAIELGATRGGTAFSIEPDIRTIEIDGQRGVTRGSQIKDSEEATLTVNLLELSPENLRRIIPGAKLDVWDDGFAHVTGAPITMSSYVENIVVTAAFVGEGRDEFAVIVLENALNTEGIELALEDKDEANPAVTFMAHYDPAVPTAVPWHILVKTTAQELAYYNAQSVAPEFTSATPATGTGGTEVAVVGTGLTSVTGLAFKQNGTTIGYVDTLTNASATGFSFEVPTQLYEGAYDLYLEHPNGSVAAGTFTVNP